MVPHVSDAWYLSFFSWLLHLVWSSLSPSVLLQISNGIISFSFMAEQHSIVYVSHLYPFTWQWTLRLFPVLAIVNTAAMNIGVHISFQISFLQIYARSGIASPHGNSIFHFLRNLHTFLYSGCTNLPSHLQCRRLSVSPQLLQYLLFVDF